MACGPPGESQPGEAMATHSRPTSGPVTSRASATRRLAGGDLGPEASGQLSRVPELADRLPGGDGGRQPGRPVRVGRVQEPGPQLGHDAGLRPGRAGEPRCDLSEIALDRWPGTWGCQ
jgi:hypothetical protein